MSIPSMKTRLGFRRPSGRTFDRKGATEVRAGPDAIKAGRVAKNRRETGSTLVQAGRTKREEDEVRISIASLERAPGRVATIVFVAISVVLAVTAASLAGRVERLESELKLLKSDLDHPRVRPLASTLGEAARPPK